MPGSPVPSNLLCHPGVRIICRLLRLQGFTKLVNLQFWLEAQVKNLLPSNLPFPIHGESLFLILKGTLLALNKTLKVWKKQRRAAGEEAAGLQDTGLATVCSKWTTLSVSFVFKAEGDRFCLSPPWSPYLLFSLNKNSPTAEAPMATEENIGSLLSTNPPII